MKTAFPRFRSPVDITLYSNVPFDNTYKNHTLISSKFKYNNSNIYNIALGSAKERFLNRKNWSATGKPFYYPRYELTGEFNFDYSNGLISSVVLELTRAQTNANYMKVVCHGQDSSDDYYYFITGIQQINYDTYKLTLELDVLMTYQDEFLEGVKNVPVLTARKHCNRYDTLGNPHCPDFKNSEDAFAGIKPSLTKSKTQIHLPTNLQKLEDVSWLYVCADADEDEEVWEYSFKGITFPLAMFCAPMGKALRFVVNDTNNVERQIFMLGLGQGYFLINNGKVHGARLSHLPPVVDTQATLTNESPYPDYITIRSPNLWLYYTDNTHYTLRWTTSMGVIEYRHKDGGKLNNLGFVYKYQYDNKYTHPSISLDIPNALSGSPSAIDYTEPRISDARLLFSPFRKYVLNARYSEGYEFFPELLFADYKALNSFTFETSATGYIADNNIITYLLQDDDSYKYYPEMNIGLSSAMNYVVPCGTNALEVFNATQQQSFYTSKVASGVTSGLSIIGGAGSIALGIAGAVGSMGMSTPASVGLIAGGATAIGSGIAGAVNTAKSTTAKIEDLKNTPDSVNVSGSNYCSDYGRVGNGFPYVITYECSQIVKTSADEFFYDYGYAISRMCYFNSELKTDIDLEQTTDDNLFGRTIFNYIQLNEDITNKINYDMPIIIKQKLSSIFNNGITLWSFFSFDELWHDNNEPSSTYYLDRWFMKDELNNTEYNLLSYLN